MKKPKFFPLWFAFPLFISGVLLSGCADFSQMSFEVKAIAKPARGEALEDGSFINQCCDFRITPSQIWLVAGDVQLTSEEPQQDPQLFTSLKPLLEPGQNIASEEIGKQGRFPGLWALNLTPGSKSHFYPAGQTEAGNWKTLKLRFGPGVRGVRGLADAITGNTMVFKGKAEKDAIKCGFTVQLNYEQGMARRIDFSNQTQQSYKHVIQINYALWLDDVRFQDLCKNKSDIVINKDNNPTYTAKIKDAIPNSITVVMDQNGTPKTTP